MNTFTSKTRRWAHGHAGMTLIEIAVAISFAVTLFAAMGTAFSALSASVDGGVLQILAKTESDRAVLALLEDLQSTNTVESDQVGTPYFTVVQTASPDRGRMAFRRVEGFQSDHETDIVNPVYGAPIRYFLDADDNLVRIQQGIRRTVANRVAVFDPFVSATGTIRLRIVTYAGAGDDRVAVENTFAVTPRNGFDR